MRSLSQEITNTFPRALLGYSPPAVRLVIEELDAFYQGQEVALSAHLWDLVRLVDWLGPVVEVVEGVLTAVLAEAPAAPAEGEQTASAWHPGVPSPPARGPLSHALLGYRRDAVQAALAELRQRWETELNARIAETAKLDAQRLAYMVRLSRAQQHLKAAQLKPLAPAAHMHTVANVVPLKTREVKVALQAQAVAAPAHAGVKVLHAWRPGSVEVTEAIESGAMAAPVHGAEARPAAGTRVLGRIQLGRVEGAAAASAAAAQAQAQVAPAADLPARQGPTLSGPEAQVQAGLTSRLELLFQRFLVGKALGADLMLPNGTSLAGKGTLITRDLVRRAEEAGLLPTLIAHMTVPGVAAD